MSAEAREGLSLEEMQKMIDKDDAESRSIYAPSGPPEPRLGAFFMKASSEERSAEFAMSQRTKIEVTFLMDLGSLSAAQTDVRNGMTSVLLRDGYRRLASDKIGVDESHFHENPDRLVYICARTSRNRIRKFIDAWNESL
jgi:hypothetical protein